LNNKGSIIALDTLNKTIKIKKTEKMVDKMQKARQKNKLNNLRFYNGTRRIKVTAYRA
jgi:hypothetical protein